MKFELFSIYRGNNESRDTGFSMVQVTPLAILLFLAVIAAFLFGGCTQKPKRDQAVIEQAIDSVIAYDTASFTQTVTFNLPVITDKPKITPRFFSSVYFDFDSDTLAPDQLRTVARAAMFLSLQPDYSVEIMGFADTVGREGYNDTLSQRRAARVWDSLCVREHPRTGIAGGSGELDGDPARARHANIRITP